ncbi:MAG: response regulator [Gemmatimonadaceae bacterium]|nr:response regulator [Gemmatimonadaceae bacterium]NUQ94594.1 response regulator [Gemmatimonadaceae bacterium]NUR20424.1 response regulator [Gemmatimonadaceae bacterium]NUS98671.1 response regulator [Gemmatimonadaceae bacterium]
MPTIMIVDDSGYTRRTHRKILEGAGYQVVEASTGMAAIEGYFLHHPDLVLLDLTMADMGGLDVLQKFRELHAGARVVVISADVQRSTGKMVAESGALGFLGKPVSAEDLIGTVREVIEADAP